MLITQLHTRNTMGRFLTVLASVTGGFFCTAYSFNRSIFRPPVALPQITTRWCGDTKIYTLTDSHLEYGPIFTVFDKKFFEEHLLSKQAISYRCDPTKSVTGKRLGELVEKLIVEIKEGKKRFSDFKLIKTGDFNFNTLCGSLILTFKDYPFVVKLFIETPQSFVRPYEKGIEPCAFFIMGGGIMRHLTGFTRIKNLQTIKKDIASDPYWAQVIDLPRKWHWLPKDVRWFEVIGQDIGNRKRVHTVLPSVYAIIADEIQIDKKKTLLNSAHALRCMKFCQFTNYHVDPHIQNFRIEKRTGKLVLIDTENFRALVGLRDRFFVDSYIAWYLRLTKKYMKDRFFRSKKDRLMAQDYAAWKDAVT